MISILITLGVLYVLLFALSIRLKDNSIADVFWGFGFTWIASMSLCMLDEPTIAQLSLTFLVVFWGIRLTTHINRKKSSHSGEDPRYAAWRKEWKYFYTRSFFQVYFLQGVLMCLVATPIFILNLSVNHEVNTYLTVIGWVVALGGFFYEAKADKELARFMKTKKKGEILTGGLRKLSRYPQYFGESVFWFGICIIASQVSIFAFVGWIVITILVRYVSGVPLLEKRYEGDKKYEAYSKETPIFFPDFRKIEIKK